MENNHRPYHPHPSQELDVVTFPRRDWVKLGEVIDKARELCRRISGLEFHPVSLFTNCGFKEWSEEYTSIRKDAAELLGDHASGRPTTLSLLADLVDQIDKGEYVDHYNHLLNMNAAFQKAKERVRGES